MPEHQNVKVFWPYNPYHSSHNLNLNDEQIKNLKENEDTLYKVPLKEYEFKFKKKPSETKSLNELDIDVKEIPIDSENSGIKKNDDGSFEYTGHGSDRGYIIELPEEISNKVKNVTSWRIDVKMKLNVDYNEDYNEKNELIKRESIKFNKNIYQHKEGETIKNTFAIAGCTQPKYYKKSQNFLPEIGESPFHLQLSVINDKKNNATVTENDDEKIIEWNWNSTEGDVKRSIITPTVLSINESYNESEIEGEIINNNYKIYNSKKINTVETSIEINKSIKKPLSFQTNTIKPSYFWVSHICSNIKTSENINMLQSDIFDGKDNKLREEYFGSINSIKNVVNEFVIYDDKYVKNIKKLKLKDKRIKNLWNDGLRCCGSNREGVWLSDNHAGIIPTSKDKNDEYRNIITSENNNSTFLGAWHNKNNIEPFKKEKIKIHFFMGHSVLKKYIVDDIVITINSPHDALEKELNRQLPTSEFENNINLLKRDIVTNLTLNNYGYKPPIEASPKPFNWIEKGEIFLPKNVLLQNQTNYIMFNVPPTNDISKNVSLYGTRHETKINYNNILSIKKLWDNCSKINKYIDIIKSDDWVPKLNYTKKELLSLTDQQILKWNSHLLIDKHFDDLISIIFNNSSNIKKNLFEFSKYKNPQDIQKELIHLQSRFNLKKYTIPIYIKNTIKNYIDHRYKLFDTDFKYESSPSFKLTVNKNMIYNTEKKIYLKNKEGENITPDFFSQNYENKKVDNKTIRLTTMENIGYGLNTFNLLDENNHVHMILPDNISNYNSGVNENKKPKIISYDLQMDLAMNGYNRNVIGNINEKKNQINLTNNIFSFGDESTLSIKLNKNKKINNRSVFYFNILNNTNYDKLFKTQDGELLNSVKFLNKKGEEFDFETTSSNNIKKFRIKYHVIHKNNGEDINSNIIFSFSPVDDKDVVKETYYLKKIWNQDGDEVENSAFDVDDEKLFDIEKNVTTVFPVLKKTEDNYLLNTQKLGKKIMINNKEHLVIKLFSTNDLTNFRNTPWNYVYNNIKLNIVIPEDNIVKLLEKNFDNTILNMNSKNSYKFEVYNSNKTNFDKVDNEVKKFYDNIDNKILQEYNSKKEIIDTYIKLKSNISTLELIPSTYNSITKDGTAPNIESVLNNLLNSGKSINMNYNELFYVKKVKMFLDFFKFQEKLVKNIYIVNPNGVVNSKTQNRKITLAKLYELTSDKFVVGELFDSEYFTLWKTKGGYDIFNTQLDDLFSLNKMIINRNENEFLKQYNRLIKSNNSIEMKEVYNKYVNNGLIKNGKGDIKNKLKLLKEREEKVREEYINELNSLLNELKNESYDKSVSYVIKFIENGVKLHNFHKPNSDQNLILKDMNEVINLLDKYRKKIQDEKVGLLNENVTPTELNEIISDLDLFGINKFINVTTGVVTNVDDNQFMYQINSIFKNKLNNEYDSAFKLLDKNWNKTDKYEYTIFTNSDKLKLNDLKNNSFNVGKDAIIIKNLEKDEINKIKTMLLNCDYHKNDIIIFSNVNETKFLSASTENDKHNGELKFIDDINKSYPIIYRRLRRKKSENQRNDYFVNLLNKYKILLDNKNVIDIDDTFIVSECGILKSKNYSYVIDNVALEIKIEALRFTNIVIDLLKNIGSLNIDLNKLDNYLRYTNKIKDFYTRDNFKDDWVEINYMLLENQKNSINRNWYNYINGQMQKFSITTKLSDFSILLQRVQRGRSVNYNVDKLTNVIALIKNVINNYNKNLLSEIDVLTKSKNSFKTSNKLLSDALEMKILDEKYQWTNLLDKSFDFVAQNIDKLEELRMSIVKDEIKEMDIILNKSENLTQDAIAILKEKIDNFEKNLYNHNDDIDYYINSIEDRIKNQENQQERKLNNVFNKLKENVYNIEKIHISELKNNGDFDDKDYNVESTKKLKESIIKAQHIGIHETDIKKYKNKYDRLIELEINKINNEINYYDSKVKKDDVNIQDINDLNEKIISEQEIINVFNEKKIYNVVEKEKEVFNQMKFNQYQVILECNDWINQINQIVNNKIYLNSKLKLQEKLKKFSNSEKYIKLLPNYEKIKFKNSVELLKDSINGSTNFGHGDGLYYNIKDENSDDKFIFIKNSKSKDGVIKWERQYNRIKLKIKCDDKTISDVNTLFYRVRYFSEIAGKVFLNINNNIYLPVKSEYVQNNKHGVNPLTQILINGFPDDINDIKDSRDPNPTILTLSTKCLPKYRNMNVIKHNQKSSTNVFFKYFMNSRQLKASYHTNNNVPLVNGGAHSRLLKLKGMHA